MHFHRNVSKIFSVAMAIPVLVFQIVFAKVNALNKIFIELSISMSLMTID